MGKTYRDHPSKRNGPKTRHADNRFLKVGIVPKCGGPGGWNCPCCGEARGNRKEIFRAIRAKNKREEREEENNARNDFSE